VPARLRGTGSLDRANAASVRANLDRERRKLLAPFAQRVFQAYLGFDKRLGHRFSDATYARIRAGWLSGLRGACTIIPGPSRPVTIAGAKIQSMIGFAPLIEGSPLSIAVITYAGNVSFGLTCDAGRPPKLADIRTVFRDAFREDGDEIPFWRSAGRDAG
jgi:hypothetical protein